MASNDELDYDDIICQNILIRKEDETEENESTVEVVKKENTDFEGHYNRQAAIYQMDENESAVHEYLETTLHYESDLSDRSTTEGSDCEPPAQTFKHTLSDLDDLDSSDSEWEAANAKKPKIKYTSLNFECDECEKKFSTKRGLDTHKRSHVRQRDKLKIKDD